MEIEKNHNELPNGKIPHTDPYKLEIQWRNVLGLTYLHYGAFVGFYYWFTLQYRWQSMVFTLFYLQFASLGITCGAHRLWAHCTYKANLPLRILLCYWQTASCQNSIHEWSRDHRVHHKYSETDADPHNAKRGFFFAHMGWLFTKKHPDVKTKGATVSMKDLEEDPLVMWQDKWFIPLTLLACFIIPTWIPVFWWGEKWGMAWNLNLARYVVSLHGTWLVNSTAHMWGGRPYDETINPAQNGVVSFLTSGEGWHNYHHVFPWDYKTAELPYYIGNLSTAVIDFFAWIGWATDLKTVNKEVVLQRMKRTGEGGGGGDSGFEGEEVVDKFTKGENNNPFMYTSIMYTFIFLFFHVSMYTFLHTGDVAK